MAKIDPKDLEFAAQQGIEMKKDNNGAVIGYKGPWLPHWYDNYTEMLRENQNELRIQRQTKAGLNAHAQTPEQAKEFEKRKKVAMVRKEKAEMAAEMAFQNK